jgi:hypothetical protein
METCSGSKQRSHAEICHTEHSSDCPLCEKILELEKAEGERDAALAQSSNFQSDYEAVNTELEALKEKTRHMTWAFEEVPAAPKTDGPEHGAGG